MPALAQLPNVSRNPSPAARGDAVRSPSSNNGAFRQLIDGTHHGETAMNRIIPIVCATLFCAASITVLAQPMATATCTKQAEEKKLAGAAKTSFLKKCEKDAETACTKDSAEKKLTGAAKT